MEKENIQTGAETNTEPLCISVPAAAKLLGVSRNTGYLMVNIGQLPVIRCGKKRLVVPVAGLMNMLQQQIEQSDSLG